MKLVVVYQVGDGYTYSCQVDQAIEYESGEALLVDLEEHAEKYNNDWPPPRDKFKNTNIRISDMIECGKYYAPSVYTLEEWWEVTRC